MFRKEEATQDNPAAAHTGTNSAENSNNSRPNAKQKASRSGRAASRERQPLYTDAANS
jgi:hypothetical protein